ADEFDVAVEAALAQLHGGARSGESRSDDEDVIGHVPDARSVPGGAACPAARGGHQTSPSGTSASASRARSIRRPAAPPRTSSAMSSATSHRLTFMPATTRSSFSQKAMKLPSSGRPRYTISAPAVSGANPVYSIPSSN